MITNIIFDKAGHILHHWKAEVVNSNNRFMNLLFNVYMQFYRLKTWEKLVIFGFPLLHRFWKNRTFHYIAALIWVIFSSGFFCWLTWCLKLAENVNFRTWLQSFYCCNLKCVLGSTIPPRLVFLTQQISLPVKLPFCMCKIMKWGNIECSSAVF